MTREWLVAVSYPADDEFTRINTGVLDGLAKVVFLDGLQEDGRREILRQADVLIGWHLSQELPAGAWQDSPRLRLVQLLSAGADALDFSAIPERPMLACNAGAYAEPIAGHVMAMARAGFPRQSPAHAGPAAFAARRPDFIYGRIRQRIRSRPRIRALRRPLPGKPTVLQAAPVCGSDE
jgi:glycerate dehydrogenase